MEQKLMETEEYTIVEFRIQDILPIALTLGIAGVGIAYTLKIMGDVKGDMTTNSVEANATGDAISGVANFTSNMGTISTIVIAAIVISILVSYLMVRMR
jgi:hypothetical protein